jgi:hypothetical protein
VSARILVDTLKPDVNIVSAERVGDEVVVKWEARDEHLDPDTLTLEYHTAESLPSVWTPVVVSPGSTEVRFRPGSPAALQVRLQVKDLVGNVGSKTADVAAAVTTASSAPPPAPPAGPPTMVAPAPPVPPSATTAGTLPPPPPPGGDPSATPFRQVSGTTRNMDQPPLWSQAGSGVNVLGGGTQPGRVIADSHGMPGGAAPPAGETAPPAGGQPGLPTPAVPLPPLQIIKDRQINLKYKVRGLGPSGLGSVELYVTRDEGRTWARANGLQTVPPSVSAEGVAPSGPVELTLPVELAGEGAYGFYIVVKSKAGLGSPPPQPGTPPLLRVEVDSTPPEATLFMPQPKEGHRDVLVLSWDAKDHNLPANPVTIEWSERRDGNWQVIARDLPNTPMSFDWKLPAGVILPPRVYLRLTVRDSAGNVCVAETPEPVLIDLSAPTVENISLAGPAQK